MNIKIIKKIFIPRENLLDYYNENDIDSNSIKERFCWNCKRELDLMDYLSECSKKDYFYKLDLWQNDKIEFYCCACFKEKQIENLNIPSKYICPGIIFTWFEHEE